MPKKHPQKHLQKTTRRPNRKVKAAKAPQSTTDEKSLVLPAAKKHTTKRQHIAAKSAVKHSSKPAKHAGKPRAAKPHIPPVKPDRPLSQLFRPVVFEKLYAFGAVTTLLVTTAFWATLGAITNQANADQLVNSYLFESQQTLHQATFPLQHSFLLKWPLFLIIKWFDFSRGAFLVMTVATVVLTIAALAWLLYRLEKRPLYFGTICLALASCLLLVPAQPYAGGLLPVNMAMVTTRNLEYAWFALLLAAAVSVQRIVSWRFWLLLAGASLLFASDKLFVVTAIGGAVVGSLAYAAARKPEQVKVTGLWLLIAVGASIAASGLLWLIQSSGITKLAGTGSGPYDLITNLHDLALGGFYTVSGILTNFGANPAFDATTLRDMPSAAISHLKSPAGPTYIINALVVAAGFIAAAVVSIRALRPAKHSKVAATHRHTKQAQTAHDVGAGQPYRLAFALILASLAASAAFIATNHQYAVDARYLGLWLFSLFVCLAAFLRTRNWPAHRLAIAGVPLILAIIGGTWGAFQSHLSESAALNGISNRNQIVVHALHDRHTPLLVGDYWRVLPARFASGNKIAVTPLESCTHPRQVLSSQAWQADLTNHNFAYLLSLDRSLTDFPACNLKSIIQSYGRPNASLVVAGSVANPKELLLFYDHGMNRVSRDYDVVADATRDVTPTILAKLPVEQTACGDRPTIMNIVAHQDDDLLFMNPDLSHAITENNCIRTIYLTAGDAGDDKFYWLNRERGSEAAYSAMLHAPLDPWVQRIVDLGQTVGSGAYATIASPRHNSNISLIFVRLPDGGLGGEGFNRSRHESLSHLESGIIEQIHTVDGQSVYTNDALRQALVNLMRTYHPTAVHTQADYEATEYPDHSDHRTVGRIVIQAKNAYTDNPAMPINFYVGYPIREHNENVSGHDLDEKMSAFFAYAHFDGGVCHSIEDCANVPTYDSYLRRQYLYDPATGKLTPEPGL